MPGHWAYITTSLRKTLVFRIRHWVSFSFIFCFHEGVHPQLTRRVIMSFPLNSLVFDSYRNTKPIQSPTFGMFGTSRPPATYHDFAPGGHASGAGAQPPRKPGNGGHLPSDALSDTYESDTLRSSSAKSSSPKKYKSWARLVTDPDNPTGPKITANTLSARLSRGRKKGSHASSASITPASAQANSTQGTSATMMNDWLSQLPHGGYSASGNGPSSHSRSTDSSLANRFQTTGLEQTSPFRVLTPVNGLSANYFDPPTGLPSRRFQLTTGGPEDYRPQTPIGGISQNITDSYGTPGRRFQLTTGGPEDYRPQTPPPQL